MMKVKLISVLALALLAVAVADRAAADGALANYAGYVRRQVSPEQVSLDIEDYLSVYRFDVGTLGVFDVALFESRTPLTAENFRNYADRGDYTGSFIHRSIPGFVVQGGGFTFSDGDGYPVAIATDPPVLNEPGIANTQGTIALAKTGAGPNTGTSQWYFNTADNAGLDDYANNGGYTVFGEVLYDGMDVIGPDGPGTGISGLRVVNAGGPFDNLPISDSYVSGPLTENDMVMFDSISQVTGQTYEVVSSSDPDLVTGAFTGSSLTLDIAYGEAGQADLTIRVTDGGGQWFEAALRIEIAPDLATLQTNWGQTGLTWEDSDLNGDGVIDTTDLVIWATYHNTPQAPEPIPEPVTLLLMTAAGLPMALKRRRSRS